MANTIDHSANAFDVLRLTAALAVLYSHSYALFGLPLPSPVVAQSYGSLGVFVFFALSGFLVCSSWDKDPHLARFWVRRWLRILPGLFVAVVFTTLVVGTLMTTLPLAAYLQSPDTWAYFASNASLVVGRFGLPGVFEHNHFANAANASLWTLRYEVFMYLGLSLLGLLTRRLPLKWPVLGLLCLLLLAQMGVHFGGPAGGAGLAPGLQARWSGLEQMLGLARIGLSFDVMDLLNLGIFFLAGSCCYLFRAKLRLSATLALLLCLVPLLVTDKFWALAALWLALPYAAVVAAYRLPAAIRRLCKHDYSYGIYIYAFPVQQVLSLWLGNSRIDWFLGLVMSAAITFGLAALSWHGVERPALSLKARLLPARPHAGGGLKSDNAA